MKLIYNVKDKPAFGQMIVFAIQQLLAIMAATIAVPMQINSVYPDAGMSTSAALFGAGVGTLVYLLFTKFKSPVFLGSSFAFIPSMLAAFSGAVSVGYLGVILGAFMAGLVYVIIALVIKFAGVKWISKLMPPVVIGPTVALIGLSLSSAAVRGIFCYADIKDANGSYIMSAQFYASLACALVALLVVILCSVYGKKMARLIPFIIGILAGYVLALGFTVIGKICEIPELRLIDFAPFAALVDGGVSVSTFLSMPEFTFLKAFVAIPEFTWANLGSVAVAYIPVAFVVFAEHIADHKNLSSIIEEDLLEEPGLHRTLLGDGVGSMAGAFFGGCPNTTYGESVGCVAITRNASVVTIVATSIMAIAVSFVSPFVAFLSSIPAGVMGGVCIALYGFIAVSGLKMIQKVDLEQNKNLFVVATILIPGIGGMALKIGEVTITAIACALILGILVNLMLNRAKNEE